MKWFAHDRTRKETNEQRWTLRFVNAQKNVEGWLRGRNFGIHPGVDEGPEGPDLQELASQTDEKKKEKERKEGRSQAI